MNVDSAKSSQPEVSITPEALLLLGMNEIAAIRVIDSDSGRVYGIFSADGVQIGQAPTRDIARAASVQNNLQPVDIH